MNYKLPELNYRYDALEPYIDARTMEIHHSKHHQAYIDNLNSVLSAHREIAEMELVQIMSKLDTLKLDNPDRNKIRNHGGGHLNHSLFWNIMDPKKEKDTKLIDRITKKYKSLEEFKKKFTDMAIAHFGSGWMWLVETDQKDLDMYSLPNQDSPYLKNHVPIIGLDVWEHAYYLKYQNRRAEYVQNWWNVLKII